MDENSQVTPNQVISVFRDHGCKNGVDLLKRLFNSTNPPDVSFIQNCFAELNKENADEAAYELLKTAAEFFPQNKKILTMLQLARKIWYDSIVKEGNSIFQAALQKAQMFAELEITDISVRKRLEEENKKTIQGQLEKAIKVFERARDLIPDALPAYEALLWCYENLEKPEQFAEIQLIVDQLKHTGRLPGNESEVEKLPPIPDDLFPQEPWMTLNPDVELKKITEDIEEKKLDDALLRVERFILQYPNSVEALHLKVRILVEKQLFRPAWRSLQQAVAIDPANPATQQLQLDFLETKLKTLMTGAELFLTKGLQLGPSMGHDQFVKAQRLLEEAAQIAPDDITILDQLYTCAMYLNDTRRAADYQDAIAAIDPRYVTTVSKLRGSSFCFLATFAYKENQASLEYFRRVRRYLIKRHAGRYFVTWYVRLSPFLVEMALKIHFPPILVRALLYPILVTSQLLLK